MDVKVNKVDFFLNVFYKNLKFAVVIVSYPVCLYSEFNNENFQK